MHLAIKISQIKSTLKLFLRNLVKILAHLFYPYYMDTTFIALDTTFVSPFEVFINYNK